MREEHFLLKVALKYLEDVVFRFSNAGRFLDGV